jgi:DNA-directed RNA polymerase subunit omega
MARVTIEDCLRRVPNRFALIHLVAKRVRQFYKGAPPLVKADNKEIVLALREIAAGKLVPTTPLPALPEKAFGGKGKEGSGSKELGESVS